MSVLEALVLGAVQGLTEFIPISSSGHLVIVPELFEWKEPGLAFDVLLHAGSLAALLAYFSSDLLSLLKGSLSGDPGARRLVVLLIVGSLPAAVAGLALGEFFEDRFTDAHAAALGLFATAAILVAGERFLARHRTGGPPLRGVEDLAPAHAATVGLAQALAILPGISRSGSTISTGLGLRMGRDTAARFSFLLAIPALFGAALLELPDLQGTSLGTGAGTAGFLASLATSYAAIAGLIRYLRARTLYPFAAYCVVAGAVFYVIL